MANEISISINVSVAKGSYRYSRTASDSITWNGDRASGGVQNIGTTPEAIVIASDVATPGVTILTNLDDTNFLTYGTYASSTYTVLGKLKPGETHLLRLGTLTLYAQADSAPCDLEFMVLSD